MNNQIDTSIPVLTEVILPEELAGTADAAINTPSAAAIPAPNETITDAAAAYPGRQEEDWLTLEQTLRENVLRQVLTRIDFVLEHRVRDNLADVLQVAVANLSTEIRSGLHKTLEEVITRAVSQEISKAKTLK